MADESKGVPTLVWVLLAAVVVWFLFQQTKKAASKATGKLGEGIGKGAVQEGVKNLGALGSFLGGLFGSKSGGAGKGGASAADSDDSDLDEDGEYDTSSFRVYDDA